MRLNLRWLIPTATVEDYDLVEDYASRSSDFPPIEVLKRKKEGVYYWVVDGHYRIAASLKRGNKDIEAFESKQENWILENLRRLFNR